MNIFNLEGGVMRTLSKFTDCIFISLMFLLCCLPVVTAGTAAVSMYYTVYKVVRHDRGYIFREYVSAFRDNLKQTVPVWLLVLAIGAMFGADLYVVARFTVEGSPLRMLSSVFFAGLTILAAWASYLFPYMARFENTRKHSMKNAAIMAIVHLPTTIFVLMLTVASALLIYITPPVILLLPAVCVWIQSFLLERVFRKYMSEEDKALEEARDRER